MTYEIDTKTATIRTTWKLTMRIRWNVHSLSPMQKTLQQASQNTETGKLRWHDVEYFVP